MKRFFSFVLLLLFIFIECDVLKGQMDGSLDLSFNPGIGVDNHVHSTAIQPDGKIIIGGKFTSYNGISSKRIARVHSDGNLDTSFNSGIGADFYVFTTAIQPDGKISLEVHLPLTMARPEIELPASILMAPLICPLTQVQGLKILQQLHMLKQLLFNQMEKSSLVVILQHTMEQTEITLPV